MRILVDMNLAPRWVDLLRDAGHDAIHWSEVGDPRAPDPQLIDWARANDALVFTHDLDFGILVAMAGASGPSIIQVRSLDVTPHAIGNLVLQVLGDHRDSLEAGAIVTIDAASARVRLLPVRKGEGGRA